jgi:putative oxidoreductase
VVKFDFLTTLLALRVVCGFFFLPHALGKFTAREAARGFFRAAGFKPEALFAYVAMVIEVSLATLLIVGVAVHWAAMAAALYLAVAALAVIKVEKKWLWHIGGCEYSVFWGSCCAILAAAT